MKCVLLFVRTESCSLVKKKTKKSTSSHISTEQVSFLSIYKVSINVDCGLRAAGCGLTIKQGFRYEKRTLD